MSTKLYKLESGGNWMLDNNIVSSNYYIQDYDYVDGVWRLGIVDPKDNSYKIPSQPITEYTKQNGDTYKTIEEINRVCNDFFGKELRDPKKQYTAFLSQSGTDDPTAIVLEDTIRDLVIERSDVGVYTITKVGAFTENKTVPNKDTYIDSEGNKYTLERTSADVMTLTTYSYLDIETPADEILDNQYFHIEIFS